MDDLPGLPIEVPQEYREQLVKFQHQIRILINNHQILVSRLRKNPQDQKVVKQIDDVKNYLISFSDQQRDVLDKVRDYLKQLEEKRTSLEDTPDIVHVPISTKQEIKTSRCSTPVKNLKNKSKKKPKGKLKPSRSISPDSTDDESDEIFLAYFDCTEGYRGHVEEYEVDCPHSSHEEELVDENLEEVSFLITEDTLATVTKENYMLNIDLLTDTQFKMSITQLEEKRKKKALKRVSTYIPEVADKKYRYQTFLQNSITSPPHLRRRKPNQLPSLPRPVKSLSFPTVEKMETRSKSPSLAKSQVDGADDISEESGNEESGTSTVYSIQERIELRNSLLKRKREMETEIETLQKKAKILQEVREVQREEKCLLLKRQMETNSKIRKLHLFMAELCHPPEIL